MPRLSHHLHSLLQRLGAQVGAGLCVIVPEGFRTLDEAEDALPPDQRLPPWASGAALLLGFLVMVLMDSLAGHGTHGSHAKRRASSAKPPLPPGPSTSPPWANGMQALAEPLLGNDAAAPPPPEGEDVLRIVVPATPTGAPAAKPSPPPAAYHAAAHAHDAAGACLPLAGEPLSAAAAAPPRAAAKWPRADRAATAPPGALLALDSPGDACSCDLCDDLGTPEPAALPPAIEVLAAAAAEQAAQDAEAQALRLPLLQQHGGAAVVAQFAQAEWEWPGRRRRRPLHRHEPHLCACWPICCQQQQEQAPPPVGGAAGPGGAGGGGGGAGAAAAAAPTGQGEWHLHTSHGRHALSSPRQALIGLVLHSGECSISAAPCRAFSVPHTRLEREPSSRAARVWAVRSGGRPGGGRGGAEQQRGGDGHRRAEHHRAQDASGERRGLPAAGRVLVASAHLVAAHLPTRAPSPVLFPGCAELRAGEPPVRLWQLKERGAVR